MKCSVANQSFDVSLASLRDLDIVEYVKSPDGAGATFKVLDAGRLLKGHVCAIEDGYRIFIQGYMIDVKKATSASTKGAKDDDGLGPLKAPYACRLLAIHVAEGDVVAEGTPLFRIESMKMEHEVTARKEVKITAVRAQSGTSLARGDVIIVTEEA